MSDNKMIENIYNLSPMQEGMLFHKLLDKDNNAYFEQSSVRIHGKLDVGLFEESINKLIEKYEVLRTRFIYENQKRPLQIVLKDLKIKLYVKDIVSLTYNEKIKFINEFKEKDIEKSFDLSKENLIRVSLIKNDEDEYIFIFSFHHIILDGWSLPIVFNDLFDIYNQLKDNGIVKLTRVNKYSNYIKWLKNQNKDEALLYWQEYLNGYEQQAQVVKSVKYVKENKYKNKYMKFTINKELTNKLKNVANKNKITINSVFQIVWAILLQRYNNTNDVVFGSVVSGRPAEFEGIENMVGLFINTVPVRVKGEKDKSFIELVKEVQDSAIKSKKYEYIPLTEIQSKTSLKQKLIDNILIFENYPVIKHGSESDHSEKTELKIEFEEMFEQTNYDFNIVISMTDEILVKLNYNELIYDKQHVKMVAEHIKQVIKEAVENPEIKLWQIEMLSEEEKKTILLDFNSTKRGYPQNKTLDELFEKQVEKTPNSVAVVYEDKRLTYKELNEKANSLAVILRRKGVGPDSIVGILVERSLEMIIGIIGILKSGGAYLPIDPEYPEDRIEYILKNSETKVVLTQSKFKEKINYKVNICDLNNEELYKDRNDNLDKIANANNLGYVIYTSGTTGKPKGVMIEHKSIINTLMWRIKYYKLNSEDAELQIPSFSFDSSVEDIFTPLLSGAKLILISQNNKMNLQYIKTCIKKNNIRYMLLVPSFYRIMLKEIRDSLQNMKGITLAGENFTKELAVEHYKNLNNVQIYNEYGPTENSVCTSIYKVDKENSRVFIGKPIDNTKCYILSKDNKLLPIGVAGELCISGVGLARGYLGNEGLTSEKFIDNPYELGEKMYKTGDLARWLPDGNMEFLGRIDYQVKIRGFRIETDEIESQLLKNEGIKEAVVVDRENKEGNKYLCAYIVCERKMTVTEIRAVLSKKLPDYMLPAYFIQIEKMPLTQNGKIDRKALPEPEGDINIEVEYAAPENEIQEKMVGIWREVLSAKKIGIDDNFFELGGDSIKAIQVSARLSKYNLKLRVTQLFENPTIRQLSAVVKQSKEQIEQVTVNGEVELTAIQRWFFEQNFTNMHHWNQSIMLHSKEGFNEEIIKKVFSNIVEHHDALRMIFRKENNGFVQYNKDIDDKLFELSVLDLKYKKLYEQEIEKESTKIQSSINLSQGPLVNLGLFKTKEGDHLLIAIHHLVVDGVSWRILLEDFALGLKQVMNGQKIELPKKTHSFKQWSENIQNYSKSSKLLEEIPYWENIEKTKVVQLPKDYETINNKKYSSKIIQMEISEENTEKLLRDTNRAYNTKINDILLAAFGIAINEWTGQDKVLINLEGHGREEILPNTNIIRTIGWFTSTYPVIIDCRMSNDIGCYLKSIKESLRKIPNKGIGYSILKYITPKSYMNNLEFKLNPQISFNYLGQFDNDVNQGGFDKSWLSMGDAISNESKRLYDININSSIIDKKLILSVEYNNEEYSRDTIKRFSETYKAVLINIINYCVKKDETEITPSDLDYKDISIDELQRLKSLVNTSFGKK